MKDTAAHYVSIIKDACNRVRMTMRPFTVLYRDESLLPADAPLAFICKADDGDHAQEQCENAYPGCDVVWVVETECVDSAYCDYYGLENDN